MVVLVKAMKNPRSALCKTSIMASSDIFNAFGDKLLDPTISNAFDQLVCTKSSFIYIYFVSFFLVFLVSFIHLPLINGMDFMVGQQLLQLLLKASQDKRFVCEEADRALNSMVRSLTPLPLLQKLRTYVRHTNPRVRAKAAISISNCVSKMVTNLS